MRILIFALAAALACAACNDKGSDQSPPAPNQAAPTPAAPSAAPLAAPAPTPSAAPAPSAPKVEIQIASVANQMAFDKKALTVMTGAVVHLTLKNNATMETLPHNWVLVRTGTEAKVAADGLDKAPDAGYVVEGDNVLAHTPLAPPGKSVEVTFTAPAPGKYPYICTFPGHYIMMKGVLTVTP
jgi:azurin